MQAVQETRRPLLFGFSMGVAKEGPIRTPPEAPGLHQPAGEALARLAHRIHGRIADPADQECHSQGSVYPCWRRADRRPLDSGCPRKNGRKRSRAGLGHCSDHSSWALTKTFYIPHRSIKATSSPPPAHQLCPATDHSEIAIHRISGQGHARWFSCSALPRGSSAYPILHKPSFRPLSTAEERRNAPGARVPGAQSLYNDVRARRACASMLTTGHAQL